MLPLLTFASGIVAGVIGVKLLKQAKAPAAIKSIAQKARSGLDKAGEELRDAAVSGLSTVEKSSASLRQKLTGESEPRSTEPATADGTAPAAPPPEQTPTPSGTRQNEEA